MGDIARDDSTDDYPSSLDRALSMVREAIDQRDRAAAEVESLRLQLGGAVEERDRLQRALDFIDKRGNASLVRDALLKAKLDLSTSGGR